MNEVNAFKIIRARDNSIFGVFNREMIHESANAIYLVQSANWENEGVNTSVITEFDKTKFRLEPSDTEPVQLEKGGDY